MTRESESTDGEGPGFVAFAGPLRIAAGSLSAVAVAARRLGNCAEIGGVLVFDATTGHVADLDLRGTEAEVAARYAIIAEQPSRRGRPKLGVTAREVTLLPRHWEWLASQPGGASVTLRKLVDAARKLEPDARAGRARVDATYRFMSAIAGDLPAFEEAARALFAGAGDRLQHCMQAWPGDIRDQVHRYLGASGQEPGDE